MTYNNRSGRNPKEQVSFILISVYVVHSVFILCILISILVVTIHCFSIKQEFGLAFNKGRIRNLPLTSFKRYIRRHINCCESPYGCKSPNAIKIWCWNTTMKGGGGDTFSIQSACFWSIVFVFLMKDVRNYLKLCQFQNNAKI